MLIYNNQFQMVNTINRFIEEVQMINRISEIPLWGPEEQIRKFIHRVDDSSVFYNYLLRKLGYAS